MKRLILIALAIAAPIAVVARLSGIAGAAESPSTGPESKPGPVWKSIAGPAAPPATPTGDLPDGAAVTGLTVHEWGTFTSVAGPAGTAVEWLPAGGPTDLPCFVNVLFGPGGDSKVALVSDQGGRSQKALVRMETPVLYFYAPQEQTVDVKVAFPKGTITEWYPPAKQDEHSVQWNTVNVLPGATASYRLEDKSSHYYAARRTDAAPVKVRDQYEKFLFYRGVGNFTPPISARSAEDNAIEVANLGSEPLPGVVLFENREGKIGYTAASNVKDSVRLTRPALNARFENLQTELETLLMAQGMFPREARAMVDTWKDSWFEQGTRIFYIVPQGAVESILPLDVQPKPLSVSRAFVGRVEVLTRDMQDVIHMAVAQKDQKTLESYGRFLEPVVTNFLADRMSAAEKQLAKEAISSLRTAYAASANACRNKVSW